MAGRGEGQGASWLVAQSDVIGLQDRNATEKIETLLSFIDHDLGDGRACVSLEGWALRRRCTGGQHPHSQKRHLPSAQLCHRAIGPAYPILSRAHRARRLSRMCSHHAPKPMVAARQKIVTWVPISVTG